MSGKEARKKLLLLPWSVDLPVLEKEGEKKTFALEHGSAAISGKEGQSVHFCIGVWMYHSVRKRGTRFLLWSLDLQQYQGKKDKVSASLLHWSVDVPQC